MNTTLKAAIQTSLTTLVRTVSSARTVERMHLAVCVPCQYDCVSCSHGGMRDAFPTYQLPLDHLREFIAFTEASRYSIKKIHLTGPGEPLLWRHLKEGIHLLRQSPAFETIHVISNGLHIQRIAPETWAQIDRLNVSVYPAFDRWDDLNAAVERYPGIVKVTRADTFQSTPGKGQTAAIPCQCDCTGPMYFDRKVFFYCGPTVFGAAHSKGVDVLDYADMYAEIGLHYLERSQAPLVHRASRFSLTLLRDSQVKTANHELCRYCFANKNFNHPEAEHVAFRDPRRNSRRAVPDGTKS